MQNKVGGGTTISDLLINEEIREKEVRLISNNGEQLGIVATKDALQRAYDEDMDLVLLAPNSKPPVAKIMDYSKYKFDQMKKEKEARRNQKIVEIKEARLSPNIGDHDFQVRVKNASKWLADGNKVKVSIRFRGREVTHQDLGHDVMAKFADEVSDVGTVDKPPKMEGRYLVMFLAPKKS